MPSGQVTFKLELLLVSRRATADRNTGSSRVCTHNSRYNCCLRREGMFGRAVSKDVMVDVKMCRRIGEKNMWHAWRNVPRLRLLG